MLSLEAGQKIFIAKGCLRAICSHMVCICSRILEIHVAWIPLVVERRHRVEAPVDKHVKLPILIPCGNRIALQQLPGCSEGAGGNDARYRLFQSFGVIVFTPSRVKLAYSNAHCSAIFVMVTVLQYLHIYRHATMLVGSYFHENSFTPSVEGASALLSIGVLCVDGTHRHSS